MERILILNKTQIGRLNNAINKKSMFSEISGIMLVGDYSVGDTAIRVDNVEEGGVYKSNFANKATYYVILKAIDVNLGFALSFYSAS